MQFSKVLGQIKPAQKTAALLILLFICFVLSTVFFRTKSTSYVALYPAPLNSSEMHAVKNYLERASVAFKEAKESILVPTKQADKIRADLGTQNILKQEQHKGFELFDSNTWIKGEKELQVLEMRALKGQLEKDLTTFEHIKSANVILDIPPARTFGSNVYKTKASVILSLMPGAKLSSSELKAITNHLTGAIRGLEPHMIAISDTTGKLYKAIDPNKEEDQLSLLQSSYEEALQGKVELFLSKLVGPENFIALVRCSFEDKREVPFSMCVSVLVDHSIGLSQIEKTELKAEIEKNLKMLVDKPALATVTCDFTPFEKRQKAALESKKESFAGLFLTLFVCALAGICSVPLFKKFAKKKKKAVQEFSASKPTVDLSRLAHSMKDEDPQAIAMMLSYLEPRNAEQLIASFPKNLQDAILTELDKEEI